MNYYEEIIQRNPHMKAVFNANGNFRIDEVIQFWHGENLVGVRVNYSYGLFHTRFGTEDFPILPPEWDLHEERIVMINGHIGTATFFPPAENKRDEASRKAILA